MKKTKLAVLFTALLAVLGFSSCLSDPDPYRDEVQIMKVIGQYYPSVEFEDAYGRKMIPTNQSLFSSVINSRYAQVQYRYDSRVVDASSGKFEAEVLGFAPLGSINYAPGESPMSNNAPMFENNSLPSKSLVGLFDKNTLLLNLFYYYKESSKQDELDAELRKHTFWLAEEKPTDEKTLTLCLIHNVVDPEKNKERVKVGSELRYFDLTDVMNGKMPEVIKIKYKIAKGNGEEIELVDAQTPIELKYKDLVDTLFPTIPQQ